MRSLEELAARSRAWRKNNPERAKLIESRRIRPDGHKERVNATARKNCAWVVKRYGVSPEVYRSRMDSACRCGVCGGHFVDEIGHALSKVYDHDHRRGTFRGVIHRSCNAGLGIFLDEPQMLRSAADYLCRGSANG